MAVKNCEICQTTTARELVVHVSCHRTEVADQTHACVECEREFGEVTVDQLVDELRAIYLPNCRPVAA